MIAWIRQGAGMRLPQRPGCQRLALWGAGNFGIVGGRGFVSSRMAAARPGPAPEQDGTPTISGRDAAAQESLDSECPELFPAKLWRTGPSVSRAAPRLMRPGSGPALKIGTVCASQPVRQRVVRDRPQGAPAGAGLQGPRPHRKTVGWGKGVSARVDPG